MNINFPVQIYSYTFARPASTDKDYFVFDLITDILFSDANSILNTGSLKKIILLMFKRWNDVWNYYPNMAVIDVIMDASPGNVKVKRAIREEINKVIADGLPQEMISNYITQYENSDILGSYDQQYFQ